MTAFIPRKPKVTIKGSPAKGYMVDIQATDGYRTVWALTEEEMELLYKKLKIKLEK